MEDYGDKIVCFQAITGLEDTDLCTEILAEHGWDLELATAAFSDLNLDNSGDSIPQNNNNGTINDDIVGSSSQFNLDSWEGVQQSELVRRELPMDAVGYDSPGLAWRLITLPSSAISGGLGFVAGAIDLGLSVAGGILSHSLSMAGWGSGSRGNASSPLLFFSTADSEALGFVTCFERDYGTIRPNFVTEGFVDAFKRSRRAFKLLFVYLHSPDHADTPLFCERTLCSEVVAAFINENFVSWAGNIRLSEGFKMSNILKASSFPFCAVVMADTNQRIAVLGQIEGPKSPEEMLTILQGIIEESAPLLVTVRLDAEERRNSIRLREEQDAAYQAALEADMVKECRRKEEQERLEREAAEAERKRKEEEEAQKRALLEAAEIESELARTRLAKAMSLGDEPEKGPNVTQIMVRFPSGERKERRFHNTATIQTLCDYVDSLDWLNGEKYSLVSNFPRVVYGPQKQTLSLKEAGLHPQASLFVELES